MVVGVGGYYGYKNAGDEAILLATVRELKARGKSPLVLSARPRETFERYAVDAVHRYSPWAILGAFRRMDRFLLGGGGLLQDRTSRRSLAYYLGLVTLARRLKRPVTVFNVSLGPLTPEGERRVARALKGVPILVRDQTSLAYARRLGLRAELGADPALLLPPPKVAREPGLVIIVPRYGVNPRPMVSASYRLLKLGYDVLVMALQPGMDEEVMEEFQGLPKEVSADPKRVLYLLASANFVISARLHGMVLAAAAGTPYAGINYDPKVEGFAKETGAPLLSTEAKTGDLVQTVTYGLEPDWERVTRLKERARASFDALFPTPAPANGV